MIVFQNKPKVVPKLYQAFSASHAALFNLNLAHLHQMFAIISSLV